MRDLQRWVVQLVWERDYIAHHDGRLESVALERLGVFSSELKGIRAKV